MAELKKRHRGVTIGILVIFITELSPLSVLITCIQNVNAAETSCIIYDKINTSIIIACDSARLTDVYNQLNNDNTILSKQSTDGREGGPAVWLLNANLIIGKGATLHIDSTDTKWLKISSGAPKSASSVSNVTPYSIDVHGSLKVDSVKITSWNSLANDYATTSITRHGDAITLGTGRPFIRVEKDATGTTDVTNSEIAYLGYEKAGRGLGASGLNFYGGDGSRLAGNNIHHLYFGFYSSGVGGLVLQKNHVHHNYLYGFDPHTGTHNMIIQNNIVNNNGAIGIICSLNCHNIVIENNEVYQNGQSGIMFSRNMTNSIAKNNNVHNETKAIFVSQSNNNQVFNNMISDSGDGINLKNGSSFNKIHNNTIINCRYGINVNTGARENSFYSNKIIDATQQRIKIDVDSESKNNTFL